MEKMYKGLIVPKRGADKLAENTLNAPKYICQNCLLKPESFGYGWKKAPLGVRCPCFMSSQFIDPKTRYSALWTHRFHMGTCMCFHESAMVIKVYSIFYVKIIPDNFDKYFS